MNGLFYLDSDYTEFVEVDPTGRYGRYNEILGKGSSKIVAFDEYEGIEVAWNQVKLNDFLQSPEDLERLYSEIHLLKTLKHKNIMKFYASWVDASNRNINFVTELFTSGTLRQYRLKHKRVNIKAVKHWCRQILRGLLYLHSHDPPIIHRDLKCDNIFINGNQGEVKIGDLGLAAILRKSHAAHCVGTPEFMAPEVYEESYNELVDIYSFGMCILEMVTFEYPYSECTHPAQIYKKVISGKKPDALYKVKDPEVGQFVEKCLATVSHRLSARELLDDPFLRNADCDSDSRELDYGVAPRRIPPLMRQPYAEFDDSAYYYSNGCLNGFGYEFLNELEYCPLDVEPGGIELFQHQDDEHSPNVDISIKGKKRDDGSVFLRLRISDKESRIRNIYFLFDIETDTALSVATEMIAELDITDQDVTKIADMIDGEICSLVPEWRPGPCIVETPSFANQTLCHNCASTRTSNGSLAEFLSTSPCCLNGCASMHGRFEQITIQADQSRDQTKESAETESNRSESKHHQEICCQQESCQVTPVGSGRSHSDEEYDKLHLSMAEKDEKESKIENETPLGRTKSVDSIQYSSGCGSFCGLPSSYGDILRSHEDEIQQKLRWLKTKYQINLRKLADQHLGLAAESSNSSQEACDEHPSKPSSYYKLHISNFHVNLNNGSPDLDAQGAQICEAKNEFLNGVNAKSYYSGSLLPISLQRTTSLPVDVVDV